MVNPVEVLCCWARSENSIPDSGFFASASVFGAPPNPPNENPANGLGLTSGFFSSVDGLSVLWLAAAVGVVVLLVNEKPPNTDLVSATGFGVPKTGGATVELGVPKAAEGATTGAVVPNSGDGVTVEAGIEGGTAVLVATSDWPFVWVT